MGEIRLATAGFWESLDVPKERMVGEYFYEIGRVWGLEDLRGMGVAL